MTSHKLFAPRPQLLHAVACMALTLQVLAGGATNGAEQSTDIRGQRSGPSPWLLDGAFAVQAMEGPGVRRGFATLETPQNIAKRLTPGMADRLQRQGVNFVILNGLMGGGLEAERDGIDRNKPLARALKAKGIRRVLYVQTIGTIFYEPFFAEMPSAVNWVQRLSNGDKPTYYSQWFRYIPCLNNDNFLDYVKRELRTVMKELDLDGIFSDNYGYYSYSCSCEHCQKKFRDYLNKRYPDAASRKARFEFTSFDFVEPPPFQLISYGAAHTQVPDDYQIVDAVSQEWIRFRCQRLGEVTEQLRLTVKESNPNAVWFVNYPYGGTPGLNNAAFHGDWPAEVYPHADLISAEVAGPPKLTASGVAQGRALIMKIAKSFGVPLSTFSGYGPLSDWKRLQLAEGMAFNTTPFDLCGDIWRDDPPDWMRKYVQFSRDHRDLLGRAATVADCAVLHNFETLSYMGSYPHESLQLCEQSLLQAGVTFDIIFDRDLDHLDKYPCLVLANVVAMSRQTAAKIAAYVRRGGSLVMTDDTSALSERMLPWKGGWLEPRKSHLLAELLGIEWPKTQLLLKQIGRGRVAVVPAVNRPWSTSAARGRADQERATLSRAMVSHSYGPAMPAILAVESLSPSHEALVKAVDYALADGRTVRVVSDGAIIPEVTRNDHGTLVHLINWTESKPVTGVRVSLAAPAGRRVNELKLLSPDPETPTVRLQFEYKDGRIQFTVPKLVCYAVIVVR